MDWNTKQVLEMAGLPAGEATATEIELARRCVEDCYYLDRAVERFARIIRGPAFLYEPRH